MPERTNPQPKAEAPGRRSGRLSRSSAEDGGPAAAVGQVTAGAKTASPARFKGADLEDNPLAKSFDQGRLQMGRLLRSWISLNGWTYDDVTSIVEALSGGLPLVHGSQISNLISGKLEPKPRLFVGLDQLNRACALKQEDRAKLPPAIAAKLIGVRVVASTQKADSSPWNAGDFLNFFCGLKSYPERWLRLDSHSANYIYNCLDTLARLIRVLADAKGDTLYASIATITDSMPMRSRTVASKALSGITVLNEEAFEEHLPQYADGISTWLGAIVTPYKLLEFMDKGWDWGPSSSAGSLLELFVNSETTLNGIIQPWTGEVDFPDEYIEDHTPVQPR